MSVNTLSIFCHFMPQGLVQFVASMFSSPEQVFRAANELNLPWIITIRRNETSGVVEIIRKWSFVFRIKGAFTVYFMGHIFYYVIYFERGKDCIVFYYLEQCKRNRFAEKRNNFIQVYLKKYFTVKYYNIKHDWLSTLYL